VGTYPRVRNNQSKDWIILDNLYGAKIAIYLAFALGMACEVSASW